MVTRTCSQGYNVQLYMYNCTISPKSRKSPNALMNCGRGCGPLRKLRTLRSGYPTIRHWSRTPKCDPKKFSILFFLVQWETFLDRILAFASIGKPCSLAQVATKSVISFLNGLHPCLQFINAFPHHSTVAAHSARATAASLNRFYWEPTGGRCVFECRCVRI